jgi:hypothetical protein
LLISPHPAERVATEVQTRLGGHLSAKGFALVAFGPTHLTWRRELGPKVIAALVFLALMAIGGIGSLADGGAAAALVGVVCGIGAVDLLRARRPATVSLALRPGTDGCEIELRTSSGMQDIEALVCAIANASPGSVGDQSIRDAESAYFAGRIDADEFESAVGDALHRDS